MQLAKSFIAFNAPAALLKSKLLPVRTDINTYPLTCSNCSFINHADHNFCINCGFPIHPNKDRLVLYNFRLNKRRNIQKSCSIKIAYARNTLYVLAAWCMFGVFYVFSESEKAFITGVVMIFLGIIYAGLGRWSLQKPFTSLLIGLMITLTFATINTWEEFTSVATTAGGMYMLVVQLILIYFLLKGVKGAFCADILEEEFKL